MNVFTRLQDPVALSIGWSLIHSLWIGTLFAICSALAMSAMRNSSAQSRYALLFASLLAIPPFAIVWPIAFDGERRTTSIGQPAAMPLTVVPARFPPHEPPPSLAGPVAVPASHEEHVDLSATVPKRQDHMASQRIGPEFPRSVMEIEVAHWLPWIVLSWLIGVSILAVRLLVGCAVIRTLRRSSASVASAEVARTASHVAARLRIRQTVQVLESALTEVPTTIGFFRPLILMPLSVLSNLTAKELESILAHELAHIHRSDFLMNVLQTILEVLMFYHPAIWWLSQRIRHERELACDDLAIQTVGDRLGYARALTEVAVQARKHRLAMSADGGQFSHRIRRIVGQSNHSRLGAFHLLSVSTLVIILFALISLVVTPADSIADKTNAPTESGAASEREDPSTNKRLKPIAGTILGPDGKPLAGASVFLRRRPFRYHKEQMELAEQMTGSDGQFEFRNIEQPTVVDSAANVYPLDVIAMKPGHSVRWKRISNAQRGIELQLKKEAVFAGRLIDDQGKPVGNAAIRVKNLMSLNTITKIDVANGHTPSANGDSFLDISKSTARIAAETDADGNFVLRQLPRRVGFVLAAYDRRLQDKIWYAATTSEELPKIPAGKRIRQPRPVTAEDVLRQRNRVEMLPIHQSPATLEASRGVHIRFHVVNDRSGEPVKGATLALPNNAGRRATTNAEGYADVHQLQRGTLNRILVSPPAAAGLLAVSELVPPTSETDLEHEIRLKLGAVLSGKVVEKKARTGVEKVTVAFVPLETTRLTTPPITSGGTVSSATGSRVVTTSTNQDGTFQLVVAETPGHVIVSRVPAGYLPPVRNEHLLQDEQTVVTPKVDVPVHDLSIAIERRAAIPIQFLNVDGKPIATSVDLRLYRTANQLRQLNVEVDGSGQLDVGRYAYGKGIPKSIQIIARSTDDRLAAFFRTNDVQGLQDAEKAHTVTLRQLASVNGKVLDKETKAPIPEANVNLMVNYTATGGQGVSAFSCDGEGSFRFDKLVPGMKYAMGARAKGYAARNSIHTQFVAKEGESHVIDIALVSNVPKAIAGLQPVRPPSIDGLDGEQALDLLKREFKTANDAYRRLLAQHKNEGSTVQIVALREPSPAFAEAIMQLADAHRNTDTELDALIWLCKAGLIAGTEHRYRHLKRDAAQRILDNYSDRAEIATATGSIIYASSDWYESALKLMKSPHREVQGRACITGADIVAQRYRDSYRGGQEVLRKRAVELYQKVIDDYADISHWRYGTIAARAEIKRFQLTDLQIGTIAPEIKGVDLNGKPMKLSDFKGKVVAIHYWESELDRFDALAEYVDRYKDKPFVLLGVSTDKDLDQAIRFAAEKGLDVRHWHDPDRAIHAKWGDSWPNTHVISHDGRILYKGQRESSRPLADVIDDAVSAAAQAR